MSIGAFAEVLHNSSLMIDDIEDHSVKRRGLDCCHVKFGVPQAINSGNTCYFVASKWALSYPDVSKRGPLAIEILTEISNLHLGQNQDITWNQKRIDVESSFFSENGYLTLCKHKTSGLLRLIAKCCSLLGSRTHSSSTDQGLIELMNGIGILFQIVDDVLNIAQSEVAGNKDGRGEDIREGNKTILIIHALNHAEESKKLRLIEILNARTSEQDQIQEAIHIIEQAGSVTFALNFVAKLKNDLFTLTEQTLKKPGTIAAMKQLIEYIVKRKN